MKIKATQQTIVFALFVVMAAGFALFLPGFARVDNLRRRGRRSTQTPATGLTRKPGTSWQAPRIATCAADAWRNSMAVKLSAM